MPTLAYSCKFCRKPGQASYDDVCGFVRAEKWAQMLCCDRCHNFYVGKRDTSERINRVCRSLWVARNQGHKNLQEIEAIAYDKLERLTKDLASMCCGYLRITNVWEPEFVGMLVERPDLSGRITLDYFARLRRLAKT